jgi:DNA-binding NarL/FixJ family response regulator
MDAVSVLVVAEDAGSRGGLVQLLSGEAGARVTGGLSPSDLVASVPTDVYAWDLGADPVQGMRQFRQYSGVQTPTLVIVGNAVQGRAAVAAGARGTINRESLRDDRGPGRLVAALRACAMGFVVVDNDAGGREAEGVDALPRTARAVNLTAREAQVITLLAEGHPNKIIADKLNISEHTAKFHVNALIHKLHAQSRTDVVAKAMRAGLLAV